MTLYWWTHWFWITAFIGIYLLGHNNFVGTYPMNTPYGNKDYSKDKPLQFPLAAQTDVATEEDNIDDVFKSDEMILSSILRNSKINKPQKDITQRANSDDSAKIKDNIVLSSATAAALGEIQPNMSHKMDGKGSSETRNGTVDINVIKNNSSKIISTQSLIGNNSSKTQAIGATNSRKLPNLDTNKTFDKVEEIEDDNEKEPQSPEEVQSLSSSTSTSIVSPTSLSPPTATTKLEIINPPSSSPPEAQSSRKHRFPFENITKEEEIIRAEIARQLDGERARKSKVLAEYRQEYRFNFSTDTKNLLARSAAISLDDFGQEQDEGNISSEALSIQRAYILDAGAISGICFAVVGIFCGVGMAGVVLYRRRYLNKPQALSEPDSSGYIDDSTIRDNSDEMYSLDNDSFLNSLEAMTIQNYWTDTVKHTKL